MYVRVLRGIGLWQFLVKRSTIIITLYERAIIPAMLKLMRTCRGILDTNLVYIPVNYIPVLKERI